MDRYSTSLVAKNPVTLRTILKQGIVYAKNKAEALRKVKEYHSDYLEISGFKIYLESAIKIPDQKTEIKKA